MEAAIKIEHSEAISRRRSKTSPSNTARVYPDFTETSLTTETILQGLWCKTFAFQIDNSKFAYKKFVEMKAIKSNSSEIKLELFRYIDNLPENKLRIFYSVIKTKEKNSTVDFWDLLTDLEKTDINEGMNDLDAGKFKDITHVLSKYS